MNRRNVDKNKNVCEKPKKIKINYLWMLTFQKVHFGGHRLPRLHHLNHDSCHIENQRISSTFF